MPEHHPSPEFSHATAPASHVFEMAQKMVDLPPQVEERKQALVREVLDLCHKHGLAHPKELETSSVASKIPLEDLKRLLACVTKLEYIVEHRTLPQEKEIDTEYTMDLPRYGLVTDSMDDHGFPVVVTKGETISVTYPFGTYTTEGLFPRVLSVKLARCQGKVVLVIESILNGFSIQDLQGNKVGSLIDDYRMVTVKDHRIVSVRSFTDEDSQSKMHVPVDEEGHIIGRPEGYSQIDLSLRVGGTSYFLAHKEHSSPSPHVYDDHGEQVDFGEYRSNSLLEKEGELILKVQKRRRAFLVHPDGSLLEGEPQDGFNDIFKPIVVEDSVYFIENGATSGLINHWSLKNHKGQCIAQGGQSDIFNRLLEMRKIGSDFFLRTADSMYRVTEEGETELLEDVNIFPVLVGQTWIFARSVNDKIYISKQEGKPFCSFDQIFALEPIDDYRFYVITKEGDQIQKRVFDIRNIVE